MYSIVEEIISTIRTIIVYAIIALLATHAIRVESKTVSPAHSFQNTVHVSDSQCRAWRPLHRPICPIPLIHADDEKKTS